MIYTAALLLVIGGTTLGLSNLKPAAPTIERAQVWLGTVERGDMVRQVRGTGVLVAEQALWIPATCAGRVQNILVLPGSAVKADTILVELNNPEVEQAVFSAEWQLKAAEAELANRKVQLQFQHLTQEATVATAHRSPGALGSTPMSTNARDQWVGPRNHRPPNPRPRPKMPRGSLRSKPSG